MRGAWIVVGLLCWGCAAPSRGVARQVEGVTVVTRRVDERALAAYARARGADARGMRAEALAEYARVLELDPGSGEAWTRIGALRCEVDPEGARAAFERAEALQPGAGPLLRARAECALARGDAAGALADARRAVAAEPDSVEGTLIYARALELGGDPGVACRWLEALVLREPSARAAWAALEALASRRGDDALARSAAERGARVGVAPPPGAARARARAELDGALVAHELDDARAVAARGGVSEGVVALRAAALGRPELAADAAELARAADPSDADAWIAAVVAASLLSDRGALEALAGGPAAGATRPAPLAIALLAELLAREVGADVARAWLTAQGPLEVGQDPLVRSVLERVAALSGTAGAAAVSTTR